MHAYHWRNKEGTRSVCGREGFAAHAREEVTCGTCISLLTDEPVEKDMVNHPDHYGGADNPYEVIKVINAWNLNFNLGTAVKYIPRAGKKDPSKHIEDLEKAIFYLKNEVEQLKGEAQR